MALTSHNFVYRFPSNTCFYGGSEAPHIRRPPLPHFAPSLLVSLVNPPAVAACVPSLPALMLCCIYPSHATLNTPLLRLIKRTFPHHARLGWPEHPHVAKTIASGYQGHLRAPPFSSTRMTAEGWIVQGAVLSSLGR